MAARIAALILLSAAVSYTTAADTALTWTITSYDDYTAVVGDTFTLTYGSNHDVYQMADQSAYDSCDFTGATELGSGSDSPYTLTISDDMAGTTVYIACSSGSHCNSGQKLAIAVDGAEEDTTTTTTDSYEMTGEWVAAVTPLSSSSSTIEGTVKVHGLTNSATDADTYGLHIAGSLTGADADTSAGIHIHTGTDCSDYGGHYYTTEEDGWNDITYSSDSSGAVSLDIYFFGLDFDESECRTVVVHDANGPAACGVLEGSCTTTTDDAATAAATDDTTTTDSSATMGSLVFGLLAVLVALIA